MAVSINEIVSFAGMDSSFTPYPQMDGRYGPYNSISEALSSITQSKRCIGLTLGIRNGNSITEYWFKTGISNSDLIEKTDDAYQNYKTKGGTKTKNDFYTTLKKVIDTSTYVILHSNVDNVKVEVTLSEGEVVEIGNSSTTPPILATTTEIPKV